MQRESIVVRFCLSLASSYGLATLTDRFADSDVAFGRAHHSRTRLFCDPKNSIEYDAVTNPYCSRRSDHGVHPSARELAEIAHSRSIVANECPKNIRILG